jgi:EAL domain-containing protein (putative c-di-GMP-specific phosphodiesterase class I)
MFRLADQCGLAAALSALFRVVALREAARLDGDLCLFLNAHPAEMENLAVLGPVAEAAAGLRAGQRLVLEAHEDAVADPPAMRQLRDRLAPLGVGLAYDDFGAGRSRLNELAEAPPDFLKLDMRLIRGIEQAPARQEVVRAMCDLSDRLGTRVIAEGVETEAEAACCRRLGCHLGQGFLFGRPQPPSALAPARPRDTRQIDMAPMLERLRQLGA